jgi:hypothetical protein
MTIIPNVRLQWGMLIQFVSSRTGFALRVGLEPKEPSRLFKTMDGGHTWHVLHPEIAPCAGPDPCRAPRGTPPRV